MKAKFILASCVAMLLAVVLAHAAETKKPGPHPKVVVLTNPAGEYLPILAGPPDSVTMHSGLVVLEPGKSVGKHSTKQYEELVIVLEGQGEMILQDGTKLPVKANSAVYCPPETEHDVLNVGNGPLRYVYVVASAKTN